MKNLAKESLAYAFLIGMSLVWLGIFILILIYGPFGVYEPNLGILLLEIAVCIGGLVLGGERVYALIRKYSRVHNIRRRYD